MNPQNGPGPECAWDLVPVCRFLNSCELILEPDDGCRTCDFMRDTPRDEDGDPLPPDPFDLLDRKL